VKLEDIPMHRGEAYLHVSNYLFQAIDNAMYYLNCKQICLWILWWVIIQHSIQSLHKFYTYRSTHF